MLELAAGVSTYDVGLTAESADGLQNIDFSGALPVGYSAATLKKVATQLQDIVSEGSLRMQVGSLAFPSGQALLDWLKASNQSFDASKLSQTAGR